MVNVSVPILMGIFLFFRPTFLFSVPILWKLHFLHPFSVLNLWESSSYYYRSNPSSPVCPARGPLQALREEALWRLAVVHLCVTTNTSGVPLSERSPKFGQPSWSSPFLLPSADFSTCLFLPVVITSCYLGHSFPSLLFSCPVPSDPLWPRGLQHARPPLSLTSPSERGSSQYL